MNDTAALQVKIASGAKVIGDVQLADGVSVWYNAVLRADSDRICIGKNTNIQDNCVLHVDHGFPCVVGENTTVGHGAILHGCTVGNNCTVGMGAIVLNGAVIEDNCLIAAGALVVQNAHIPAGSLVMGSPGKVRRELSQGEIEHQYQSALHYRQLASEQL